MSIINQYKPYDFSKCKCHVIKIEVNREQVLKIEEKLPLHVEKLTGIYITCNALARERVIGYITLMFNEGILKTAYLPILNSTRIKHHSHPIPIVETIKRNGIMLGYLYLIARSKQPFTVKIYLHYERS